MTTCQTSNDCPGWLDKCAEITDRNGTVLSPKVCQCTGSLSSCDSYANGFRCNAVDNLCEPPCRNSSDCLFFTPPRGCNQYANVCEPAQPCQRNADCFAAQPRCDQSYGRCFGCQSNADCAGRSDNLTECARNGACTRPLSSSPSPSQ